MGALAQPTPPAPPAPVDPDTLRQLQQQREEQQRKALEREPDVLLKAPAPPLPPWLVADEAPCFVIRHIHLDVEPRARHLERLAPALDGPQGLDPPLGRCLGAQGINILAGRLQQAILARGYITTRVLAAPQDLSQGRLVLTVVPGRVHQVRVKEGSSPQLRLSNALPVRPGDLLDLRDIEQGLENLQRVPGSQAGFEIEPAQGSTDAGLSDLVVSYQGGRGWRTQFWLDDSGSDATGRYPLALTASLDHALTLNDLFYLTLNRDSGALRRATRNDAGPSSGTAGHVLHYSVPWGHALLSLTVSRSGYRQVVIGAFQDYVYRGTSRQGELRLNWMAWRDGQHKLSLWLKAQGRSSRNFIDDTEVEVQRRRVGGWEAGLGLHRASTGFSGDLRLSFRRGTGAFSALAAPEEEFGEGHSRVRLLQGELGLNWVRPLGERPLQLSLQWRGQMALRPLTPQDRFAIGGRYTVRGFDNQSSLAADHGLLCRSEAELPLTPLASLYLGLDAGWLRGANTDRLAGRHLAGAALGTRWRWRGVSLDVFAAAPLRQPERFPVARVVAGFNLGYSP